MRKTLTAALAALTLALPAQAQECTTLDLRWDYTAGIVTEADHIEGVQASMWGRFLVVRTDKQVTAFGDGQPLAFYDPSDELYSVGVPIGTAQVQLCPGHDVTGLHQAVGQDLNTEDEVAEATNPNPIVDSDVPNPYLPAGVRYQ